MAQSNNESNVRGIPPYSINAKENVDIENLLNPSERHHPLPLTLKSSTENKSEIQRKTWIERIIQEQKRYDDEEAASIKTETKKLNGI